MKKILLILILVLMASPVYAFTSAIQGVVAGSYVVSGGTCTIGSGNNWVNSHHEDYWSITTANEDYNGQEVANSGSKNICRVVAWIGNFGSTANMTLHLKSDWGGTHYGSSDAVAITGGDGTRSQYTFTFSPAVTVTGNFVIEFNWAGVEAIIGVAYGTGTDGVYFGGTDYKWRDDNTERDEDIGMEIYYEQ